MPTTVKPRRVLSGKSLSRASNESVGHSIAQALLMLTQSYVTRRRHQIGAYRLGALQVQGLIHVAGTGQKGTSLLPLAEALGVTPPTASALLDSLQAKGLITKRREAYDGRVLHSSCTGEGRRVARQWRQRKDPMRTAIARLSRRDQQQLEASLSRLLEQLTPS